MSRQDWTFEALFWGMVLIAALAPAQWALAATRFLFVWALFITAIGYAQFFSRNGRLAEAGEAHVRITLILSGTQWTAMIGNMWLRPAGLALAGLWPLAALAALGYGVWILEQRFMTSEIRKFLASRDRKDPETQALAVALTRRAPGPRDSVN